MSMQQTEPRAPDGCAQPQAAGRLLEAGWYGVAFAAFLALGLTNLFYPFGDDQAVLFFAARELDRGATLYLDYWGNKQPGLYLFYWLACRLFGFSELGVHLLELIWMSAFALVLMVTLRRDLRAPWLSALAPLATIGIYYATAREDELTQLEILVAFPLYLTAWSALRAVASPVPASGGGTGRRAPGGSAAGPQSRLLFFSGLCAGVAVLFKLLLAPVAVAFWLIVSWYLLRDRVLSMPALLLRVWLPVAAGVALPLSVVMLWFWHAGALRELLWTAFIYPPEALMTAPPASKTRLLTAASFLASNFAPWLLFAGIAVAAWWRAAAWRPVTLLLAWLVLALGSFLIQRFSWWPYHTLLLFTPLGLLAVFGLDRAAAAIARVTDFGPVLGHDRIGRLGRSLSPLMLCSLLLAVPTAASLTGPFLHKFKPLMSEAVMSGLGIPAYQWKVAPNYKQLWEGSRFLKAPTARPGPIYSFGSAMVYAFSEREAAHRTAGFSWNFYLSSQVEGILAALEAQQVPYVFVQRASYQLFERWPTVAAYVNANYRRISKDDSGIWYERLP